MCFYPDAYVLTDTPGFHLAQAMIALCDPTKPESWAGCMQPVIACIGAETAEREDIMQVLRGMNARIYVLKEITA